MVANEHLFVEVTSLALDTEDVKRLLLIPSLDEYGDKLQEVIVKYTSEEESKEKKEITVFCMDEPAYPLPCSDDLLGSSLLRAFNIHPEELK